ncbi:hypothetical protein DPEC_G00246240 [Dallia pectoralis]|uniref:Uncharacterized protein n=1 Tax=Dallia pectoralis TaxID=75939 RepID=A0ACC2FWE6_DALPE|nr:hypothetical protein DPEC_G00246240 [Dallia pectoralis]
MSNLQGCKNHPIRYHGEWDKNLLLACSVTKVNLDLWRKANRKVTYGHQPGLQKFSGRINNRSTGFVAFISQCVGKSSGEALSLRVVLKVPPAAMWSVFFVFLSYLDKNFVKGEFPKYSLDAKKESKDVFFMLNSTFCAKVSGIGGHVLHQVSDGAEEVRSVRNHAHKLVDCAITTDQMQVKAFMHVCRLGLKDRRTDSEYRDLYFADMAEAKFNCESFQRTVKRTAVTAERDGAPPAQTSAKTEIPAHGKEEPVIRRTRRGFTYPGTLWCGAGNMADNYHELGEFAATDSCCRVHDHCPYVIHPFSSNYGYTNFKWHSLSHCDCDNALKDCLRKVNDTSSRVVGQAFFNVIEVPCFDFKYEEQCVERHWYGTCKRYGMLPVAMPRESVLYDYGGIDVIDVLTLAPVVRKEKKKAATEQDETEGTTQSSPNVFTAAEDFIKVLATVSTSQGTATDTTKGETQTSEKKKRKNTAGTKRKMKKGKGKGKGRKRKQKMLSKGAEDGITVSPTKAEEVDNKGNFVNEPEKGDQLNRNVKSFTDGEKDLGGKDKFNNDVMRDEPFVDYQRAAIPSVHSVAAVQKAQIIHESLDLMDHTEAASPSTATAAAIVTAPKTKRQRSRKGEGRKRQSNMTLTAPTNRVASHNAIKGDLPIMTTGNSGILIIPASAALISTEQPEQQRLERRREKGLVTAMAAPNTSIVTAIKRKSINHLTRSRSRKRAQSREV